MLALVKCLYTCFGRLSYLVSCFLGQMELSVLELSVLPLIWDTLRMHRDRVKAF